MALAYGDVQFWRALRDKDLLPLAGSPRVLEIGEANWYGDIPADSVPEIVRGGGVGRDAWETAKAFYRGFLGLSATFTAVDMHGTPSALRLDLNQPVLGLGVFDLVINSGTAEHVFDQCQLFRTIHERTKPGGLMVHALPVSGWPDHGFFNYHPGLFQDLAAANGYEVLLTAYWETATNRQIAPGWEKSMPVSDLTMNLAMRRKTQGDFQVPMQGRYQGEKT